LIVLTDFLDDGAVLGDRLTDIGSNSDEEFVPAAEETVGECNIFLQSDFVIQSQSSDCTIC
jgi:hypothetical protein